MVAQGLHGLLDRGEVSGVEDAGLGLEVRPDDAHPYSVKAVGGQESCVVVAEPAGTGLTGRHLVHLVEPVQHDDLSVAVGEPAAGGPDGVRTGGDAGAIVADRAVDAQRAGIAAGPTESGQSIRGVAGAGVTTVAADARERSARTAVAAVGAGATVAAGSSVADDPGSAAVTAGNTGLGAVPAWPAVAE